MIVTGGATDVTTYFQMRLLAGGDATGLTISDFDMQYVRSGDTPAAKADAVALAAANTAHTDNRGIEVDATDTPGLYRFDWPDAAFAAATRQVILSIKHASCFTESLRVEIDATVTAGNVTGFSDTGVNDRLGRIGSDADTGLRTHIDDLDTGLHAHINDVDTGVVEKVLQGVRDRVWNADMGEVTDSGTESRRTPLQAIRTLRNRVELDTGAFIVMKEDDSTASFTGVLVTDTGAAPIKTINPA